MKTSVVVNKIARSTSHHLKHLMGILLVLMVVLNGANAVGRYAFQSSINGADEILVYAMVWLVFLGAAVVSWDRRHLRVDFLLLAMPKKWRNRLYVVQEVVLVGLCTLVLVQSLSVIGLLDRIDQRSMAAEIPMTIPHMAIAIGLGMAAVLAAARLSVGNYDHDEEAKTDGRSHPTQVQEIGQ